MSDKRTIGARCKYLRIKKGWTMRTLAEQMSDNLSWQSIQALEQDRVKHPRYIAMLAETLNTSQEYLQMGITQPNESTLVAEILTQTIDLVENINSNYKIKLSPPQKSKLITCIYEDAIRLRALD